VLKVFLLTLCLGLGYMAFSENSIIGTQAPEWNNDRWINSPPLTLSQLRGKVIFIRFFMDSTCPFCSASAPFLNEFHEKYRDQGLVVVGMYTPKPQPRPTETRLVQQYVKDYGFSFPVSVDDEWATLRKYWLDRVPSAEYTSVSFLVDKKGVIRFIHPGGAYDKEDVGIIKKEIEKLISEP
jgi:thiol-disulfide isomerase/thioredoxin